MPDSPQQKTRTMADCDSCGDGDHELCPNSKSRCGHHCNHSWSHERCCWCEKTWEGE